MNREFTIIAVATAIVTGCSSMNDNQGRSLFGSTGGFKDTTKMSGLMTDGARSGGWGDYDADGCVDLLITEATGARLFRNSCNGTFSDVSQSVGISAPKGGFGIAWADYDGDGDLDVYVASADTANVLYRNDGNGRFTDVASTSGVADMRSSTGAAWADYDGDGDLDLFVANRFFPEPDSEITDRLYRNDGNGVFTDVGVESGVAVVNRKTFMGAWFDYDNNGTLDLYQAVDFGDDRLFHNDGRGGFTDVTGKAGISGPAHAMGLAVGDINGDGCFDVVSTNNTRGNPEDLEHGPSTLYLNNCDGTFSDATAVWGLEDRGTVDWGVNMVDWDNDGDEDLSIVAGGMLEGGEKETNVLYENRDGRLLDVTDRLNARVDGAAFGSAWADYDNDGDLDWLIVNSKKNVVLLENHAAPGHHLVVRTDLSDGHRMVGARVDITAGGKTQSRTVQAGKGYAASEELEAHFGLGSIGNVSQLRITWPDGRVSELSDLKANQTVIVIPPERDYGLERVTAADRRQ